MSGFKTIFETREQEAERVRAEAERDGEKSTAHTLAQLPVTNWNARAGQIVELTRISHDTKGEYTIIGMLTRRQVPGPKRTNAEGKIIDTTGFGLTVLASTHPSYPVGGYDITVSTEEARRSRLITEADLLSLVR